MTLMTVDDVANYIIAALQNDQLCVIDATWRGKQVEVICARTDSTTVIPLAIPLTPDLAADVSYQGVKTKLARVHMVGDGPVVSTSIGEA